MLKKYESTDPVMDILSDKSGAPIIKIVSRSIFLRVYRNINMSIADRCMGYLLADIDSAVYSTIEELNEN